MSVSYNVVLNECSELDNKLWGGAADKWNNATDEQKELIWNNLCDFNEFDSFTQINDYIWYDCDEIFYPEEDIDYESEVEDWFAYFCENQKFNSVKDTIEYLQTIANHDNSYVINQCMEYLIHCTDKKVFKIIEDILANKAIKLLNKIEEELRNNSNQISNNDIFRPVDRKTITIYEDVINQVLRFKYSKKDNFAMFATSVVFDFSCLNLSCYDYRNHNEYIISNIRVLSTDKFSKMKFIIGNDEYNSFESFKTALFELCNIYLSHLNKVKPYNL